MASAPAAVLIEAFDVPPHADDAFVAAWERDAARTGALYRALRADVTLRFVHISPVAVEDAAVPGAGLYEIDDEDGEPGGAGGVLLICPYAVPVGEEDRFATAWSAVRELLAPRQGYLGSRLHRSTGTDGFRFVPVVRWSSPLMHARALREPEIAEAIAALPFPGRPALYLRHGGDA